MNRREFYQGGKLARAEEDTNGDGKTDTWETYSDGALASVTSTRTTTASPTGASPTAQTA